MSVCCRLAVAIVQAKENLLWPVHVCVLQPSCSYSTSQIELIVSGACVCVLQSSCSYCTSQIELIVSGACVCVAGQLQLLYQPNRTYFVRCMCVCCRLAVAIVPAKQNLLCPVHVCVLQASCSYCTSQIELIVSGACVCVAGQLQLLYQPNRTYCVRCICVCCRLAVAIVPAKQNLLCPVHVCVLQASCSYCTSQIELIVSGACVCVVVQLQLLYKPNRTYCVQCMCVCCRLAVAIVLAKQNLLCPVHVCVLQASCSYCTSQIELIVSGAYVCVAGQLQLLYQPNRTYCVRCMCVCCRLAVAIVLAKQNLLCPVHVCVLQSSCSYCTSQIELIVSGVCCRLAVAIVPAKQNLQCLVHVCVLQPSCSYCTSQIELIVSVIQHGDSTPTHSTIKMGINRDKNNLRRQ